MDQIYITDDIYVSTTLNSFTIKPEKNLLNHYPSEGALQSVQNNIVFNYKIVDNELKCDRAPSKLLPKQKMYAYAATANIELPTGEEKALLRKKLEKSRLALGPEFIQYLVNQAQALKGNYPYNSQEPAPSSLSTIGDDGLEHVCRHFVVQNSLMYELNKIPHRLVNGDVYDEVTKQKYGHAIIQVQDSQTTYFIDPTHIGTKLEKGVSKQEVIDSVRKQQNRPFFEKLRIQEIEYVSLTDFQELFKNSIVLQST